MGNSLNKLVIEYSDKHNTDILYINSSMSGYIDRLIYSKIMVRGDKKKENITLVLVTDGGNPDISYRIAHLLQKNYENFDIIIPGSCKSAGTLLTIGANNIYFYGLGELGPLDIQMSKKEELVGYISGLDLPYGFNELKKNSFDMFIEIMVRTHFSSQGRVTLKNASEIATTLTKAYLEKISEQISPGEMGETARLMRIAIDYGERLNKKYENLKSDAELSKLVSGYPSHGFVIDLPEAQTLFKRAFECTLEMEGILFSDFIGPVGWYPRADGSQKIVFLNDASEEGDENDEQRESGEASGGNEESSEQGAADNGGSGATSDRRQKTKQRERAKTGKQQGRQESDE